MLQNSPVLQANKHLHRVMLLLNQKEQLYVEARLHGSPPYVAARTAGFDNSKEMGKTLDDDPRIIAALRYSLQVKSHQVQLTRDHVLAGLMDAVTMAATATELVGAWREIGKMIGAYEPSKVEVGVRREKDVQALSDSDLTKLAALDGEYQVLDFEDDVSDADYTETPREEAPNDRPDDS